MSTKIKLWGNEYTVVQQQESFLIVEMNRKGLGKWTMDKIRKIVSSTYII